MWYPMWYLCDIPCDTSCGIRYCAYPLGAWCVCVKEGGLRGMSEWSSHTLFVFVSFFLCVSLISSVPHFFFSPHAYLVWYWQDCVCVCVCVCVCFYVCVCVCVCVCQRERVFILRCRQNRCFGHADTAFPERPIFGPIRSMTPSGKWMSMCMHLWVCMCV